MKQFSWAFWLWMAVCYPQLRTQTLEWGFFGHRKINKMAIFTLPEEMLPLYKNNLEYLEEHAVDPDKRRYATPFEAIRHYIDLDQWGVPPHPNLPRDWNSALALHSQLHLITETGDTLVFHFQKENADTFCIHPGGHFISVSDYQRFFRKKILPQYFNDAWQCAPDTISKYLKLPLQGTLCFWKDTLSAHGILPYYLPIALEKLSRAFADKNKDRILQYSAEIGHYIGDAHVPLHTTKNYNGQLTGQYGIHAFWESRLPELFADEEYDFFAGKADYIKDPQSFFWKIVYDSHQLLPAILEGEKWLSETFPKDNQFCYDERLGQTVRIQCREYARAYHDQMRGMVEERMRNAIQAIGSAWYTAWVNAGQPDLTQIDLNNGSFAPEKEPDQKKAGANIKVREHEDGNK